LQAKRGALKLQLMVGVTLMNVKFIYISLHNIFTTRCCACMVNAVVMCICLSISHTPVLCQNGWT